MTATATATPTPTPKVYIVMGGWGSAHESDEWPVRGFLTQAEADRFAIHLNGLLDARTKARAFARRYTRNQTRRAFSELIAANISDKLAQLDPKLGAPDAYYVEELELGGTPL